MITVTTASRLHFGLLSLAAERERWPDRTGTPTLAARRFGGVGLMIEQPGVRLTVTPAADWSAEGPLADRALACARRFARTGRDLPPQQIAIEACAPEHVGLGTGTQLSLAVARALAEVAGFQLPATELARRVGRGQRSGLGVHGFAQGGFLVDGGKLSEEEIAPLVARVAFPEDWHVLLVLPLDASGLHGDREQEAIARLDRSLAATDTLCRIVLLGLLPALVEADLDAFGEALHDFNARAGEAFAPAQGGVYASPRVAEVVAFLRTLGVKGVGQSSWGPGVFAVAGDADRATDVAERVQSRFGLAPEQAFVTRAANHGAEVHRQ